MWYYHLKFAQIWNVNYSDDSLTEMITALYELTYKYNMMNHPYHEFNGVPQRFDNILNNVKKNAQILVKKIASILYDVFDDWLEYHALLSPRTWADKRLQQWEDTEGDDYSDYGNFLSTMGIGESIKIDDAQLVEAIDNCLKQNKMPYLTQALEGYREALIAEDEEEQNAEYIKNMSFMDMYYNYFGDIQTAIEVLDNYGNLRGIIIDIAACYHFALWYKLWKDRGIDETRKRVENAFAMIKKLSNLSFNESLAAINIIINTAHQTGGMIDYIVEKTIDNDQELLQTLTRLSNQTDFTDWDNDLRSVGLKI